MKFLKYFFEYIKNLVKKSKNKTGESNLEESSNQKQVIEDYECLYNQIEVGDIIRAKRYRNELEKNSIPQGHREGPYIVIEKKEGELICTQGTSVVPFQEDYDTYFYLNMEGYNLIKDTFFKLFRMDFVSNNQIIKVIDKLKEKDKERLFKQIKLFTKSYYTNKGKSIKLNLPIQVGDIINYESQSFIVIDIEGKNIICLSLKNNINYKDNEQLEYNNFKNLDYTKTICFEISDKIRYTNTINHKCLKNILNDWQEYINNCKNVDITQRGSIVIKENNYYYIYGEEGQDWLAFEISKNYIRNAEKIKIGNFEYYTNYRDLKINKKENLINVYLCNEKDKDKIKQLRKNYKELNKNKFLYLNIGDIIETSNNKRYIIIKLHPKTYECLSIDKIKVGVYDPVLIRKIDSRPSSNISIEGIKWLEWNPDFKLTKIGEQRNLDKIFQAQKKYLKESQDLNETKKMQAKRGTIIYKNKKQYYIYGEEANCWLAFELEKEFCSKQDKLEINNQIYYTNYVDLKIDKSDEFSIIYYCVEQEMDNIKEKRKLYKKLISAGLKFYKNEVKSKEINCVIKCNEFSEETFVVKEILGDILVCVSSIDLGLANAKKHYFNKNNVIYVKNKQKRK